MCIITDFCKMAGITKDQFYGKEEISGSLDLRSLTSIPEGFNPTVGGSLDLESLTSIPEGFNPTVGGYLDLRSLTSIPEGFNPTVGGSLYLESLTSIPDHLRNPKRPTEPLTWQNGKFVLIDGILSEVINHRGGVWRTKRIHSSDVEYIVTDGTRYSHGATLQEAKEDLAYKIVDHNSDRFKGVDIDLPMTFSEAVECYRVITGACAAGVRGFVKSIGHDTSHGATIRQMIEMTKGQYGASTFASFFNDEVA